MKAEYVEVERIRIPPPLPELGGKERVTAGGTVNVPALAGAVHVNPADNFDAPDEVPLIWMVLLLAPPVQVTVTPLVRVTSVIAD